MNLILLLALVHRARALYDLDSIYDELEFLRDTLRQNDNSIQQTSRALSTTIRVPLPNYKPNLVALLSYVRSIFSHISRLLSGYIKYVGLQTRKISSFIQPIKDILGLKMLRL
jgi:hypothetical protein